ncbi:hypothetical protein Nepgr_030927 [Nepenthes gracilis]|uniref:Retrotransposon gag domain-containing protein n=1 Tax=Nepenthes gracilis TaxID=150966 RepID=A0AAD3Y6J3_NEPGR|nr:hypothetical protein Nepgr_030927 [Nepenthes gracilis]
MAKVIEALAPPTPPTPVITPVPTHHERSVYDRFTNERVPELPGEPDLLKADTWPQRLKKVFAVIKCSAEDMVFYATHKLTGEAHHWWEMQKRVFNTEDEFLRLRQGTCSMAEYDAKFTELSRYAPYMVEDQEQKARRFFQGLRDDIRRHPLTLTLATYREVLEKAVIYEKELERGVLLRQRTFGQISRVSTSGGPSKKVLLKMKDFDATLGMDWLARYHAKIDYFRKRVEFAIPGNKPFYIQGVRRKEASCFISSLHDRHLISDGCQAYLAFVSVTTESQESLAKDIPVVREFEDIFPDELPGLPPQRELEFGVELMPGSAPISKAPYRMALAELKELKQ